MFMIIRLFVAVGLVVATTGALRGQGYGGHSGGGMQNQQPRTSQPTQATEPQTQTKQEHVVVMGGADVTAGIQQYIEAAARKSSDKQLHVKHAGQDIALDSLKVHDDRMADLGGGKFVGCTNMRGGDGKSYDIDFFLTGQRGNLKVTKVSVHKIDGEALYSWKKQGGVWKMSK